MPRFFEHRNFSRRSPRSSPLIKKSTMQEGTVIKSTGSWYAVRFDSGDVWQCRIIGKFRLAGLMITNPVAVGDRVLVAPESPEKGMIKVILPRKNYVSRQSPRQPKFVHLLASNVDQAILITTVVDPMLKLGFIDRYLLMTEPQDVPTAIVFNKKDLWDDEAMALFEETRDVYEKIGYRVLATSTRTGEGLDDFRGILKGKTSLVSGQSGVGKSTLVNALQPQLELKTGEISDYSGKGQHTTTFAEMFALDFGGSIIDTPGIKTLAFNNLEPMDAAHNFREFFKKSAGCRFGAQCLHRNEPACAVRAAVETGEFSARRYEHYLTILEEIEDLNFWERHREF